LLAVPAPKAAGCVLVSKLPDHPLAVTALNFGREAAAVDLGAAGKNVTGEWVDIVSGELAGPASDGKVKVRVPALTGTPQWILVLLV
jgi:hypothetical protein